MLTKRLLDISVSDGLELSGVLYLPVNYNLQSKEKLPMILWAYPREFKDRKSAGQSTKNSNRFTYPLLWLDGLLDYKRIRYFG